MQTSRFGRAAARIILVLTCLPAWAAPALTRVQDLLYIADGRKFNGLAIIHWQSFTSYDGSNIAAGSMTVRIVDGVLRVQLVPTANSIPASYYSVRYNSDGKTQFIETWSVPVSASPVALTTVRVLGSTPVIGESTGPIEIADVTGLVDELVARPLKGPGYAPSRAAVIGETGLIEAADGDPADCVRVDGTSGPCGTSASAGPGFVDNETPAGTIDGINRVFTVAAPPEPDASLALYRNGLLQKAGFDYTLDGATITFVEAATPQAGDVLLASYRISSAGPGAVAPAQVLCSGTGGETSAETPTSLAQCDILSGFLNPGDRVEIRFDVAHTGTGAGFSFEVKWGESTIFSRTADAAEGLLTGRAELGIHAAGAQFSSQNWGSVTAFSAGVGSSADNGAAGLTIDLLGRMAAATSDAVHLRQFTVLRYPAP